MSGHIWEMTVSTSTTDLGRCETTVCTACHFTRVLFVPVGSRREWVPPVTWQCPGEPLQYQRGSHLMTWPPAGTKRTDDGTGDTETWEPA